MDDYCSWSGASFGGDMPLWHTASDSSSCGSGHHLHLQRAGAEQQDVVISYPQMHEQQLQQIYAMMEMELVDQQDGVHGVPAQAASVQPSAASSSSTLRSFTGSAGETSPLLLAAASATATSSAHHHPAAAEAAATVSSPHIPLSPFTFGDDDLDVLPDLAEIMRQEDHPPPQEEHTRHRGASAFPPYVPHLGPRMEKPKPGAGGQRAIKTTMSVVAKMHRDRLSQWQSYQTAMAAPPSSVDMSNCIQLQHLLSERKRRGKINDSFKALSAVLPATSLKQDNKTSILMRARDYVNTLKSRVFELEEKIRVLVQSQLHCIDYGGEHHNDCSGNIENNDISRTTADETSQEVFLKILVSSRCLQAMDAVAGTLECLKQIGDVRLVTMDTGSSSCGLPTGKAFQQATITLQLKQPNRDMATIP